MGHDCIWNLPKLRIYTHEDSLKYLQTCSRTRTSRTKHDPYFAWHTSQIVRHKMVSPSKKESHTSLQCMVCLHVCSTQVSHKIIPVLRKAVASFKNRTLYDRWVVVMSRWQGEPADGPKGGWGSESLSLSLTLSLSLSLLLFNSLCHLFSVYLYLSLCLSICLSICLYCSVVAVVVVM